MVDLLFPAGPQTPAETVVAEIDAARAVDGLRVGDPRMVDFLTGLARPLLAPDVTRRYPELGTLGFFLRPTRLREVLDRAGDGPADTVRSARGLIFHLPPANVDTIFVYSWALAALAGNAGIVRVSPRAGGATTLLLRLLNEQLTTADPVIARTQRMVGYGHDDSVTGTFSAACDLRVIWGGDETVRRIRAIPLAPAARDLTFPDRSSFAVVAIDAWRAADESTRDDLARRLANDAYWFDQAACSSPRALFLIGAATHAAAVRDDLLTRVAAAAHDQERDRDPAMAVQRRVSAYDLVAAGSAEAVWPYGSAVLGVGLTSPADTPRRWLGAGVFPVATVPTLTDLAAILQRRDQTLAVFGFTPAQLRDLVGSIGSGGVDRIVPLGSALAFTPVWDGYDLFAEFCRLTTITVEST